MTFIYKMNLIKLAQEEKLPEKWNEAAESLGIQTTKTPIGVNLIPNMTSNTTPIGICKASGKLTEANMLVNDISESTINGMAWRFFNSTVNDYKGSQGVSIVSEKKTSRSLWFCYELDPSQYNNGCFDPGTYLFRTRYGSNGYNHLVEGDVRVKLDDDTWRVVGHYTTDYNKDSYPMTPWVQELEFTIDRKFKLIQYVKMNTFDFDHTRNYYRYGTELIRLK